VAEPVTGQIHVLGFSKIHTGDGLVGIVKKKGKKSSRRSNLLKMRKLRNWIRKKP